MTAPDTGTRSALAIVAHPDDIEFNMAGTLTLLRRQGWQIHCFQLASGNLGSATLAPDEIALIRSQEAQDAARVLDAHWHPPITGDLEVFYESKRIRQVAAIVRATQPSILLTHGPADYMEDHMITCRLAVTAAFSRGMPNFKTLPEHPIYTGPLRVYHAMPHGLVDGLGREIRPDFFVDTESVQSIKRDALACHKSQQSWLDTTQGMGSYLSVMDEQAAELGRRSGRFNRAEAWQRHSHLGFCQPEFDPLQAALSGSGWIVQA